MRRRLLVLPHRRQQPPSTRPNTGPFSKQRVLSRSRKAATSLPAPAPEQSGGYLQVSRVDLPPVQQQSSGSTGVKTADGYGPYGPAPITDGSYPGPRVYSPYDQPNGGYPPPPPPPSGGYNPPPPGYYGGGPSNYAPPPPPPQDPGGDPYAYRQQSQNQQNGRGYKQRAAARVCVLRARSEKQRARGRPENG